MVDEADRMLDLGFSDDLAEVNQLTIGRTDAALRINGSSFRKMNAHPRLYPGVIPTLCDPGCERWSWRRKHSANGWLKGFGSGRNRWYDFGLC